MHFNSYRNPTYAFVGLAQLLLAGGQQIVSRNGTVKELTNIHIGIGNMRERCYVLNHRNDNIFAKIAETLWVLSGRNDIKWLSAYLPRAVDYSDDGTTWRAGYGARLRHFGRVWDPDGAFTDPGVDQIKAVYDLLSKDKYSRRAVASLWDPATDYEDSKDIPCNDWIQFLVRDNKLHMSVAQRSSDLLWGFSGINTFEWSVLQEAMASWLNVEVGEFNYFIGSLHLYEPHWERVTKIIHDFTYADTIYDNQYRPVSIFTGYSDFHEDMKRVFELEASAREGQFPDAASIVCDPFLAACASMLQIWWKLDMYKYGDTVTIPGTVQPRTDFYAAAREYLERTKHVMAV